jgi:hypothetical protein
MSTPRSSSATISYVKLAAAAAATTQARLNRTFCFDAPSTTTGTTSAGKAGTLEIASDMIFGMPVAALAARKRIAQRARSRIPFRTEPCAKERRENAAIYRRKSQDRLAGAAKNLCQRFDRRTQTTLTQ